MEGGKGLSLPAVPVLRKKQDEKTASIQSASNVVQLTTDTAAEELYKGGEVKVKNAHFKKGFNEKHGVTKSDLGEIQEKLDTLRASAPKRTNVTVDMTNQANWPTAGGMNETDAKIVAGVLGWEEDSSSWACSDPGHTPKGKVYTNGTVYYGADNTGHVGWGFKVWNKKKKGVLDYKGNISWDGEAWQHDARGTK